MRANTAVDKTIFFKRQDKDKNEKATDTNAIPTPLDVTHTEEGKKIRVRNSTQVMSPHPIHGFSHRSYLMARNLIFGGTKTSTAFQSADSFFRSPSFLSSSLLLLCVLDDR